MQKMTARNKMMDFLARRDHSEKEIRQKLRTRFTPEEIDKAIEFGKSRGWLPQTNNDEKNLAQKVAESLHRKKKGILYINSYLSQKGLPEVEADGALELAKARELIKDKKFKVSGSSRDELQKLRARMGRFLMSRGFDSGVVRKVIYEKL